MGPDGGFITGSDFLMDGGVTAAYWYGDLRRSAHVDEEENSHAYCKGGYSRRPRSTDNACPSEAERRRSMRATVMYRAGDVRVENVPDAKIVEPTDALVRVTRRVSAAAISGRTTRCRPSETGNRMGHEFIGVVESIGTDVRTVKKGDLVVAPFAWSDGTCEFCQQGLQTSCLHGGWWGGTRRSTAAKAEAVRVPQADGTLVALPVGA